MAGRWPRVGATGWGLGHTQVVLAAVLSCTSAFWEVRLPASCTVWRATTAMSRIPVRQNV